MPIFLPDDGPKDEPRLCYHCSDEIVVGDDFVKIGDSDFAHRECAIEAGDIEGEDLEEDEED